MQLVDLALSGIADIKSSAQVQFRPGLNALVCDRVKPDTLLTGLLELLFAEGYDPAAVRLAAIGAKSTKGVVTVTGHDKATFRIVRELVRGSAQLTEFQPTTKTFTPVSTDAAEIAQFLRGRVGMPSRQVFEPAFLLGPTDLPKGAKGNAPVATPAAALDPVPAEPASATPLLSPDDYREAKQRLKVLDDGLARMGEVEQLEYELDGVNKRRYEVEDRMRKLAPDDHSVAAAREEIERLAYLNELPRDFQPRYERYLELKRHRDADLERWKAERNSLEQHVEHLAPRPVHRDTRVWGGAVIAAIAVGAGLALGGQLRYLAFIDIPALGVTTLALWQHLSAREELEIHKHKLALSDRRRAKLLERDKDEIGTIESMIAKTGLSSPGEILRALDERVRAIETLIQLEDELKRARANPELASLAAEKAELDTKAQGIERRLAGASSASADTVEMKTEADAIRARLRSHDAAFTGAAPDPVSATSGTGHAPSSVPLAARAAAGKNAASKPLAGSSEAGPLKRQLDAACDLLVGRPHDICERLSERAGPIATHLSGKRIEGCTLDARGNVSVRLAGQAQEVPLADLPAAAQEVAYLSLRAALLVAVDARSRCPLIVRDLQGSLASGAAVANALFGLLAQAGIQVISLVTTPAQAAGVPHVVQVVPT